MQTKKNSFIIYNDQLDILDDLTNEQAGILLKAMLKYSLTGEVIELPLVLKIAFTPIRQQMDRNNQKYENICERNRKNIEKRWDTKNTTGKIGIPKNTKNTDNDTDTDNDKDNNSLTESERDGIAKDYKVSPQTVVEYQKDFFLWKESNPTSKKIQSRTLKPTIMSWIRRDIKSGLLKPQKSLEEKIVEAGYEF